VTRLLTGLDRERLRRIGAFAGHDLHPLVVQSTWTFFRGLHGSGLRAILWAIRAEIRSRRASIQAYFLIEIWYRGVLRLDDGAIERRILG
jgi:hypothetical protein